MIFLFRIDGCILIGLNDMETEGTFVWADGMTCAYKNFAIGSPAPSFLGASSKDINCLFGVFSQLKWLNSEDDTTHSFLCTGYGKSDTISGT